MTWVHCLALFHWGIVIYVAKVQDVKVPSGGGIDVGSVIATNTRTPSTTCRCLGNVQIAERFNMKAQPKNVQRNKNSILQLDMHTFSGRQYRMEEPWFMCCWKQSY